MFAGGSTDTIWVANPAVAGDLIYFSELGLSIPPVDLPEGSTDYWESVSLEAIGKFQTDTLFSSYHGLPIEDFTAIPTVALPAVQAGQVYTWNQDFIASYQGLTAILNDLTAAIESAEIVTGE